MMKQFEVVEKRKLHMCKKRLEQHYDFTEPEWQKHIIEIMTQYGKQREFKGDDQFQKFTLNVNFKKDTDREFFKALLSARVPKIHSIFLSYIDDNSIGDIINFFSNSFPHRIDSLVLNFSGRPESKDTLLNLGLLINSLIEVSDLIIEEIQIWNCKITAKVLSDLVVNFCHVKKLWICWSLFNLDGQDDLDFALADEPKIEEISFEGCGDAVLNNWGEKPEQLNQIMRAFSHSDIKDSIRQVLLDDWDIDDSQIDQIMSANGITYNR